MSKIRVLLIEDNRLLREGIAAMLNDQPDIRALSSAGSNGDTIKKAARQRPHVVLLDIGLKNQSSLKLAEQIKKKLPKTELVVIDLIPTHHDVMEFVKAGISGFIKKDALVDDMLKTIRKVAKGKKVLPAPSDSPLFSKVVELAIKNGTTNRLVAAVKMSKREQNVITLLSQGHNHKDIASKLKLTIISVKGHVQSVYEKLALYSRLELASFSLTRDGSKKTLASPTQNIH
ncbi:MAG TPA: response regulator transcription factor [candidate division Zixibacteria bacterium]|nr:response regulator transcription factor [candidate division Zixibacteria bacterium]